jgi:hypothetical protein
MIDTKAVFNFGHIVTGENNEFCFSEGGPQLIAIIDPDGYSLAEFAVALQAAMRDAGALAYVVSVNRTGNANTLTISAPSNFQLLVATGTSLNPGWELAGFTGADRTGSANYTGNSKSGLQYYPQFLLQSYVPKAHAQESYDYTLNRSASGREELIRFGVDKFIEAEIRFVTNLPMDGVVIESRPNGVEKAVEFLEYITQKQRFEFVPDRATPLTFEKVIISSLPGFNDGTGFRLRELLDLNLRDIYDVGLMRMRVLED